MEDILRNIIIGFSSFLLIYFIFINLTYTTFILVTLKYMYESIFTFDKVGDKALFSDDSYTPLSIIVPAYNEELTIVSNIKSLLSLNYPEFEIIVVNDGSKDKTHEIVKQAFNLVEIELPLELKLNHNKINGLYVSSEYPNLIFVDKENGGKSDALNAGINISHYPIFCSIDADSLLENDSLLRGVRTIVEDKEVIAVGGVIRVLNGCEIEEGIVTEIKKPDKIIESLQAVEYIRGFLPGRTAWNMFGQSLLIISGAFGLFKKDIVIEMDGFRHTVGEDMDLILRMHKKCREEKRKYKVLFIPAPVCYTQVPDNLSSLLKQRNRWHRGLIDSLVYNREMIFNPKYGVIGCLAIPYFLLIEVLGPIIEFFGYLTVILFFLLGYLSFEFAIMFFIVAVLWSICINIGSVLLDSLFFKTYKDLKSVLLLCLFSIAEMFGYRQLIVIERVFATFEFRQKGWNHLQRNEIK